MVYLGGLHFFDTLAALWYGFVFFLGLFVPGTPKRPFISLFWFRETTSSRVMTKSTKIGLLSWCLWLVDKEWNVINFLSVF